MPSFFTYNLGAQYNTPSYYHKAFENKLIHNRTVFCLTSLGLGADCISVVSGPTTMKFCTGIDHQSLIYKKSLYKINDVIDNDVIVLCIHEKTDVINNYVIILRPLSFVQKYTKQMQLIPLL